jgi:eukaryotic-like serine/threonine-protein kinase
MSATFSCQSVRIFCRLGSSMNVASRIASFGAYALDLRSGELRKFGTKIGMGEQPFQILCMLLEKPGVMVSREELRTRLWPGDTFVDFDHGLNSAVQRLRDCLSDSANNPRWIETIPRRGYRFIGEVELSREHAGFRPRQDGGHERLPASAQEDFLPAASATAPALQQASRPIRGKILVVSSFVVIAALSGLLALRPHRVPAIPGKVVLGDVANSTGEMIFDATLRQGLTAQLQQSPSLRFLSDEQIHQTLRMMSQETGAMLTPELTRAICQRTQSAVALNGSIALIGNRYDLVLKAVDCASGEYLASTEAQADDKNRVLDALGKVASQMRAQLGESLGSVRKYDVPLFQVTTPSLEALQSYSLGAKVESQTGEFAAAVPFFQKAIEIDPNFAMANWALGDAYSTLGETSLGAKYVRKAFALRADVSERERSVIEADYYVYVTGDIPNARRSLGLYAKMYPDDELPHNYLASCYMNLGQYKAALAESQEALRLAPYESFLYRLVAMDHLVLEQVDAAEGMVKGAHVKGLDSDLPPILYAIGFYRHDTAEMARQLADTAAKPGMEDMLLAMEADSVAYEGRLGNSRDSSQRAIASAESAGEKEMAAGYSTVAALREVLFGNSQRARTLAARIQKKSRGREVDYGVMLVFAFTGDVRQAERLADQFAKNYSDDTIVQINYLPVVRAKLALSRSNPQKALDILAASGPYELGLPSVSYYNWPNLYPVYVRGEAYLAAHRAGEAAAEFQKILDHRGIVLNEPIGVLAHLQIGRAHAMAGDLVKAKAAYQDFFEIWKNADPEIPLLKQAKAEYRKLH